MKAISPMIAMVLLIAFVVAVGGLLSVWLSSLTSSQTTSVESGTTALSRCAGTSLSVDEVRYPASGSPARANVTVSSSGTQTLKNITITVSGGGASTNTIKFFNATGDDFFAGQVFSTSISTVGGALLPPEIVSVTGVCQNQYAVTGSCRAGDACMKPA